MSRLPLVLLLVAACDNAGGDEKGEETDTDVDTVETDAEPPADDTDDTTPGDDTDPPSPTKGCERPDPTTVDGVDCDGSLCTLSGTITQSLTLDADHQWLLEGGVFIGDDVNETLLCVDPGTTIYGDNVTEAFLVVQRSSRLIAVGTPEAPITFTSAKEDGQRASQDWGGVALNGRAPTNVCEELSNCDAPGEANTGLYGGDDPADSCGHLEYVRIEFAGKLVNETKQLNGLALQGCGSGTVLDYLHIHNIADDGIEFFGGTANLRHALITAPGDDGLDWTDGWTGNAQFVIVQQWSSDGDNGLECDNNEDNFDLEPRSAPTLQNITVLGGQSGSAAAGSADAGMLLRHGTAARIRKAIVAGWGESCVDIDSYGTYDHAWDGAALSGALELSGSLFYCPSAADPFRADGDDADAGSGAAPPFTTDAFVRTLNAGNQVINPQLRAPFSEGSADFRPSASSPALNATGNDFADPWFVATSYVGGMGEDDWTAGWTVFPAN
jgi:hypothetical protein